MDSLPFVQLHDFERDISEPEQFNPSDDNPSSFPMSENIQQTIPGALSVEIVGNRQSSLFNTEPNLIKYKETQITAIQIEKSNQSSYTETLAVFHRIYSKIVSSYLSQISSLERKSSKKIIYFDKCELFSNLQLESSFTTLKQIINRSQLQFSHKSSILRIFDSHNQLRVFLSNILSNGYEEINNEFIYFVYDIVQQLKSLIFQNEEKTQNKSESQSLEFIDKEKKSLGSLEMEKLMKKKLQEIDFFQRIYHQKTIRYLNCQEISSPVSDQRVKQAFLRFSRLYSHLVIKLIIMDMPQLEEKGKKNRIPVKRMNSCEQRLMEMKKQGTEGKKNHCLETMENWFRSSSVAKSFNSINSLGSINLNNLNDIKIYNSKPDLWSDDDQERFYNFSEEDFSTVEKQED